jgi:hypothetical protein
MGDRRVAEAVGVRSQGLGDAREEAVDALAGFVCRGGGVEASKSWKSGFGREEVGDEARGGGGKWLPEKLAEGHYIVCCYEVFWASNWKIREGKKAVRCEVMMTRVKLSFKVTRRRSSGQQFIVLQGEAN